MEDIIDRRRTAKGIEYLIRWKGYGSEEDSWEPIAHLKNAPDALRSYHQRISSGGGLYEQPALDTISKDQDDGVPRTSLSKQLTWWRTLNGSRQVADISD